VITETGIEPIIYTNSNYAINYLDPSITEYDLWIANWFVEHPDPGIWDTWSFWQYSDSGSVPGISGNVDLDEFNGDTSWLEGFAITELSINNVQLAEGNSGTKYFHFTVSLSSPSSRAVTVDYQTANGAATAGSDYFARSGTLTFLAGQTSRTISVPVIGDTTVESDEAFYVNLSSPRGAILTDSQGRGTIQNDDAPPVQVIGRERNDANEHYDELTSLAFTFSKDVSASIDVNDLSLMNDTTSTPVNMAGAVVQYNPPGSPPNTARWDLSALSLPIAYYSATLSATGITDAAGNPLDGNGDGTGGDDYVLNDILVARRGDADLDADVDFTDFNELANDYTGPGGTGKDWARGDFDGDGDVDFTDFNYLANNYTGPAGYLEGKGESDLGETQQAGLFSGLERPEPSGSRAAKVEEESLAMLRVRVALARLATLRAVNVARAGADKGSAQDAVLQPLGQEEPRTPRTLAGRAEWLYEFEPMGIKNWPSKRATSAEDAVDKLLSGRFE
jgi:hypothetical protein